MNVGIYIPSRGRAGAVRTLDAIPPAMLADTHIVCTHGEAKAYRHHYFGAAKEPGLPIIIEAPKAVTNIGEKRDWIVKHATKEGYTHIIMLDDDLRFAKRRADDLTKFTSMTSKDYAAMFKELTALFGTFEHVGVLGREGANRITDKRVFATRAVRVLGYKLDTLKRLKFRFATADLMCDFDATLTLLRAGLANAVLCNYVQDQGSSNAPGGCSLYRTPERQTAAAQALHTLHPAFVKVVQKATKTAWGGGTRTDVVVAWKKALAAGWDLS